MKSDDHSVQYTFNDTLASVALGLSQQSFMVAFLGICPVSDVYKQIHKRFRIMDFDVKKFPLLTWTALMFGVDLAFYWAHRLCHEFHVLWAGHSVHHSGEEFNMATALRQGMIQYLFSWITQLPLALIFPFPSLSVHNQLNTLYQFWIHTELVGRLGCFEHFLNTPSHHRMHHKPPGNCNYGGVLIIWDRIFGTFVPETERLDYYGLAQSPESFETLELNTQHLRKWRRIPHSSEMLHCFTTRAKHVWSHCRPLAIFDQIAPFSKGKAWELPQGKPRRAKYEGACLDTCRRLLAILLFAVGLVSSNSMHTAAKRSRSPVRMRCLLAITSILSLSSAGKLLDSGKIQFGFREASTMSAILAVGTSLRHGQ